MCATKRDEVEEDVDLSCDDWDVELAALSLK